MTAYARYSSALGLYVLMEIEDGKVLRMELTSDEPEYAPSSEHPYLDRVIAHLSTGQDDLADIPVSIEGSPFRLQVLEALRRIPPGETRTYGEVAKQIGRPNAARAVGSACASNPVPIIVPCHRVVPSGGGLGNYSATGGVATKKRLLQKEGAID